MRPAGHKPKPAALRLASEVLGIIWALVAVGSPIPQFCCLRCLWSLLGQYLVPAALLREHLSLLASLTSGESLTIEPLPSQLHTASSQGLCTGNLKSDIPIHCLVSVAFWNLGTNFHPFSSLTTCNCGCRHQIWLSVPDEAWHP